MSFELEFLEYWEIFPIGNFFENLPLPVIQHIYALKSSKSATLWIKDGS